MELIIHRRSDGSDAQGDVFRMVAVGTVTLVNGFMWPMRLHRCLPALLPHPASNYGERLAITSAINGFLWITQVIINAMQGLGVFGTDEVLDEIENSPGGILSET